MTSVGGEPSHALKGCIVFCDLNQRCVEAERWLEPLQLRNPLGPQGHAALPQSPSTAAGATEHMSHEHTQGGTGSVAIVVMTCCFDGLIQPWIEYGDVMPLLRQLPSGAEANGASTNNSYGMGQLKASVGITSE